MMLVDPPKMKTISVADDNTPFQAKLQSKEGNKKLVLYPHGGPHSNSFRFFSKLRLDLQKFCIEIRLSKLSIGSNRL